MRKIKFIIGKFIYTAFAQFLPCSFSKLRLGQKQIRRFCGKMMLNKCGKKVNIERRAVFAKSVELGDYSGIGVNAIIGDYCTIGSNVMMGRDCIIYTHNHKTDDITRPMRGQNYTKTAPVTIGDDVWIGDRVIILPGVHIGNHVIIGAGAVVPKDIPDWAVAVGNPVRVVKYRNAEAKE